METTTPLKQLECCLDKGLKPVYIKNVDQIYEATKHCAVYLNESVDPKTFLREVFKFYLYGMRNVSAHCDHEEYEKELCREPTETWFFIYFIFWLLTLLIGVIANCMVLIALFKSSALKKTLTNYFVASLAFSDLLVAVFIIPFKADYAYHNHNFCATLTVCRVYFNTDVTFFVASITNLFAIAIDRFFAVYKPYKYKRFVNRARVGVVIVAIWLYSTVWGLLVNFNFDTSKFNSIFIDHNRCSIENGVETIVQYILVFFIPAFTMPIMYLRILKITFHNVGSLRRNSACRMKENISFIKRRRIEFKATKVVVIVYGSFLICWLPLVTIVTINIIYDDIITSSAVYVMFGEILPIINSLLNPFLYGLLHRDFKDSLKHILKLGKTKRVRRNSTSSNDETVKTDHVTIPLEMIHDPVNDVNIGSPEHQGLEQLIYSPAGAESLKHTIYIPGHHSLDDMIANSPFKGKKYSPTNSVIIE